MINSKEWVLGVLTPCPKHIKVQLKVGVTY